MSETPKIPNLGELLKAKLDAVPGGLAITVWDLSRKLNVKTAEILSELKEMGMDNYTLNMAIAADVAEAIVERIKCVKAPMHTEKYNFDVPQAGQIPEFSIPRIQAMKMFRSICGTSLYAARTIIDNNFKEENVNADEFSNMIRAYLNLKG